MPLHHLLHDNLVIYNFTGWYTAKWDYQMQSSQSNHSVFLWQLAMISKECKKASQKVNGGLSHNRGKVILSFLPPIIWQFSMVVALPPYPPFLHTINKIILDVSTLNNSQIKGT